VVTIACLFFGNTHVKLLRFMAVNGVFWQVVVLAVANKIAARRFLRHIAEATEVAAAL
jgi:hypothetical protein